MIENKLKVFSVLRAIIQKNPHDTKAYDCLKLMCESSIHSIESGTLDDVRFSRWELKSQVDGKLVAGNIDSKELQKWMDDRKLTKILNSLLNCDKQAFEKIGMIPVIKKSESNGGRGNERLYWLDIEKIIVIDDLVEILELENIYQITYSRVDASEVKISWFYKWFFKNGEMKNRSLRGILFMSFIFLSSIFWFLYFVVSAFFLVRSGENFTSFSLFLMVGLTIAAWMMWKYWYMPIWSLPDHRVIKAPMPILAISELDADIEMYRDKDKNKITRFTRFTATCPICTADIILREGQPYQNAPLVGRCTESPFAHVYSFDRMTMKGYLWTTFNEP